MQWDPARDLMTSEDKGKQPRKMLRERAIQIGMKDELSAYFVENARVLDCCILGWRGLFAREESEIRGCCWVPAPVGVEVPACVRGFRLHTSRGG